ncbi:IucA/IucC family protein [Paenibacillus sp. 32O-W]|uniref:IucA/IucC family protein n=1 Tax=Paenibacillus sp. 32O-W TaxID=1695218 RepID=UPI0011A22019|nr:MULTISPECIES: IucA/IucC family protein [Paenibacillaceae]
METLLNKNNWVERFSDSNKEFALRSAEQFTVFNVLRAFINESLIASEAALGCISCVNVYPEDLNCPDDYLVFLVQLNNHDTQFHIIATIDYCGDINEIHSIYEVATNKKIDVSIDWICHLLNIHPEAKGLLEANMNMAYIMGQNLRTLRQTKRHNIKELMHLKKELYVELEQKYNIERPQINPISHAFIGDHCHHPYLMENKEIEVPLFASKSGKISIQKQTMNLTDQSIMLFDKVCQGKAMIPIHPFSLPHLFEKMPKLKEDLIKIGTIRCAPTTSIRTLLYSEDSGTYSDFHIKCTYTGQITSHSRVLNREEALNGILTSQVFMQIYEKGIWPQGVHFIPEFAMIYHQECSILTCLLRGGINSVYPALKNDEILLPSFAMVSSPPSGELTVFEELLGMSHLSIVELFYNISQCLVEGYLELLKFGLGHESHAQNTLLVWSNKERAFTGICLRDIESTKISKELLGRYGISSNHINSTNAAQTRSMSVLPDNDPYLRSYFLTTGYTHGIIDSQLNYLIKFISKQYSVKSEKLIEIVNSIYSKWWKKSEFPFETYKLYMLDLSVRRNLLSKGLNLKNTPVPYRSVRKNELYLNYNTMSKVLGN